MRRYSYAGDPTVQEDQDDTIFSSVQYIKKKIAKPPSPTRVQSTKDDYDDTYWTSSEADDNHGWTGPSNNHRKRPQKTEEPIVASINRDKGAVIHITLNQIPAPKATKNNEARNRPSVSSDEPPAPPDPPSPPAPPAPAPLPPVVTPPAPSAPFFGFYGQPNLPQMMVSPCDIDNKLHDKCEQEKQALKILSVLQR
jgi:hypothetical protein